MPKKEKHAAKRTLYLCAGWSQVTWDCCISGMSNHLSIQVLQVIQYFRAVIIFASMISVKAKLHPREAFGRCRWRITVSTRWIVWHISLHGILGVPKTLSGVAQIYPPLLSQSPSNHPSNVSRTRNCVCPHSFFFPLPFVSFLDRCS
jgi:hypothetical protein